MNASSKLGIIAGAGAAPRQVIAACQAEARPFFLLPLEGQAEPDLPGELPHAWITFGGFGHLQKVCAAQGITEVVMIGRVRRPKIKDLKLDWLGLKVVGKIGLNAFGDDGLLRAVGKAIEEECKVRVIGAHQIMTDLLAPEGVLTQAQPDDAARADILLGWEEAGKLGARDEGQAVIVCGGNILGLEDESGTDALIARCSATRCCGEGTGILVKRAKPQQDDRYDLPTIGPETIEALAEAGFAGVVIEAGRSLILERPKTIQKANEARLFVLGVKG